MSMLEQFSSVMNSNIGINLCKNGSSVELIDGLLIQFKKDILNVKQETYAIIQCAEKAEQKLHDCNTQIQLYTSAIEMAVVQGELDDARKMIAKKHQFELSLAALQNNVKIANSNVLKIQQMHDKLATEIEQMESRKAALKIKPFVHKVIPEPVSQMLDGCSAKELSCESDDSVETELRSVQKKVMTNSID